MAQVSVGYMIKSQSKPEKEKRRG